MRRSRLIRVACRVLNPLTTSEDLKRLRKDLSAWSHRDWIVTVSMLDTASLLPAWGWRLAELGWDDVMPVDIGEGCDAALKLNQLRNGQVLRELRNVSNCLSSCDCPHVFLKGTSHLLSDLYQDNGQRLTTDLDVLVHEDKIHTAVTALSEMGFQFSEDVERQVELGAHLATHFHLPPLIHSKTIADVELHIRFSKDGKWPFAQDIFENCCDVSALSKGYVPSREINAALAVLHTEARLKMVIGSIHLKDGLDLLMMVSRRRVSIHDLRSQMRKCGRGAEVDRFLAQTQWFFGELTTGTKSLEYPVWRRMTASLKSHALCVDAIVTVSRSLLRAGHILLSLKNSSETRRKVWYFAVSPEYRTMRRNGQTRLPQAVIKK